MCGLDSRQISENESRLSPDQGQWLNTIKTSIVGASEESLAREVEVILSTLSASVEQAVKRGDKSLDLLMIPDNLLNNNATQAGKTCSVSSLPSITLLGLCKVLQEEGLEPFIRAEASGHSQRAYIAIKVPDTFKHEVRSGVNELQALRHVLHQYLTNMRNCLFEKAGLGSYVDALAVETDNETSANVRARQFEEVLTLSRRTFCYSQSFLDSVNVLIACAYLGKDADYCAAVRQSLSRIVNASASDVGQMGDLDFSGTLQNSVGIWQTLIERLGNELLSGSEKAGPDQSVLDARANLLAVARERLEDYKRSLNALEQMSSARPETKVGRTQRETVASLSADRLDAITALTRASIERDFKGPLTHPYLSASAVKSALAGGAILISHWRDSPELKMEELDGVLLCERGAVSLAVVSPNATSVTHQALSNRLLLELQQTEYCRIEAWLDVNRQAPRKEDLSGLLPDFVPEFQGKRNAPVYSGLPLWVRGSVAVDPVVRCRHADLALKSEVFIARGLQAQHSWLEKKTPRFSAVGPPLEEALGLGSYLASRPRRRYLDTFNLGAIYANMNTIRSGHEPPKILKAKSFADFMNRAAGNVSVRIEYQDKFGAVGRLLGRKKIVLRFDSVTTTRKFLSYCEKLGTVSGSKGYSSVITSKIKNLSEVICAQRCQELANKRPELSLKLLLGEESQLDSDTFRFRSTSLSRIKAALINLDAMLAWAVTQHRTEVFLCPIVKKDIHPGAGISHFGSIGRFNWQESISNPLIRLICSKLEERGLTPFLHMNEFAFPPALSLAVRVPEAVKKAVLSEAALLPNVLDEIKPLVQMVERTACELAARYVDSNTGKFLREPAEGGKVDLQYEKILRLLNEVQICGRAFSRSLETLACAAYLGSVVPEDKVLGIIEEERDSLQSKISAVSGSERSWISHCAKTFMTVAERIAQDIKAHDDRELQSKIAMAAAVHKASEDYLQSIKVIAEATSLLSNEVSTKITSLLEEDQLSDEISIQLSALARQAPSPMNKGLVRNKGRGLISDNYYSPQYFKVAVHCGGKLIAHWDRNRETGIRKLSGFLLFKDGGVDLLCVGQKADVLTGFRLTDRLILELQGSEQRSCGAWIYAGNSDSYRLALSKGWIPDEDVQTFSAQGEAKQWLHGQILVRHEDRRRQLACIEPARLFIEQALKRSNPQPGVAVGEQDTCENADNHIKGEGETLAKLESQSSRLLQAGPASTCMTKSIEDFIDLAQGGINIAFSLDNKFNMKRIIGGPTNNKSAYINFHSVTTSGQRVLFRERIFADWWLVGGSHLRCTDNELTLHGLVHAIYRRDVLRRFLPERRIDVCNEAAQPLTKKQEGEVTQMAQRMGIPMVDMR